MSKIKDSGAQLAESQEERQLKAIFYLLQTYVDGIKDDVDSSFALLQIGTETTLTKKVKAAITDPAKTLLNSVNVVDKKLAGLIDNEVKRFFSANKSIVKSVLRHNTSELSYYVVLHEDTHGNRNSIFSFFNVYEETEFHHKYPVHFQIVPPELESRIVNFAEKYIPA